MCSTAEIERYWRRIGGALLDRIDIRIPLKPVSPEIILEDGGEGSFDLRRRIDKALAMQRNRFRGAAAGRNAGLGQKGGCTRNGRIPASKIREYCRLSGETKGAFTNAVDKLGLSSRACHSVLKVARTVADLEESEEVKKIHILEAVQHRRYGDGDYFWSERF
jgi:magnesium chelatase family protein